MVILKAAFWMSVFSIVMLPLMFIPSLQLTDAMRTLKGELMARRFLKNKQALFIPIVMLLRRLSTRGNHFYKRLASLLAYKWGDGYSVVMGWLHCSLSFSLLQSAIACVHGACSSICYVPLPLEWSPNIFINFDDN